MKKVVLGITSLTVGGAEKVLVDLVNCLKDRYDITILTIYGGGKFESMVDKKVKIINIFDKPYKDYSFIKRKLISLVFLFKILRKRIYMKYIKDKYDVEIAFLEGPITTLFSTCPKANSIAWIHNDISLVFGKGIKAIVKKLVNKKIYSKYNHLVFVSKDNLEKFNKIYNIKNDKRVIYNYLNIDSVLEKAKAFKPEKMNDKKPSFLVVARLVAQKGLMRLLKVHRKLINNGFKHNIYIIGDGPLKEELESKIIEYKLNKSFILLGEKSNPYPYMKKADALLLPSLYEGYGMVIIEGRILKKYILITDTAAREALIGYKNATIVSNNEKGLYNGLKDLIEKKYKIYNVKPYSNDDIINDIIKLIEG